MPQTQEEAAVTKNARAISEAKRAEDLQFRVKTNNALALLKAAIRTGSDNDPVVKEPTFEELKIMQNENKWRQEFDNLQQKIKENPLTPEEQAKLENAKSGYIKLGPNPIDQEEEEKTSPYQTVLSKRAEQEEIKKAAFFEQLMEEKRARENFELERRQRHIKEDAAKNLLKHQAAERSAPAPPITRKLKELFNSMSENRKIENRKMAKRRSKEATRAAKAARAAELMN